MSNFKNSPLSKVLNNKTNLIEVLLVAIVIAFGTNLIATSILNLTFWNNKTFYVVGFGISIIGLSFVYLIKPMFRNSEYNKKITANIVYDKKNDNIIKIKNYDYSEKVYGFLDKAFNESKDIKAIWDNNELNLEENSGKKSKSVQLIEEATEYKLLDTVSKHLNTYFNSEYISENNITIINRDDISEIVTKNKFLDLFSKPKNERSAFINNKLLEKESSVIQDNLSKGLYNRFELKVPKNSQLVREDDGSITIKNERFILNFKVEFTGVESFEIPSDYLKIFHQLTKDEYSQYEIDVKINIEFLKNTFFSNKSWEYYNWLDSLINKIEEDFCPLKFKEEINWKSNQLILDYLELNMPSKVKNKETYIFYANPNNIQHSNIFNDLDSGTYLRKYLESDLSESAIQKLKNQKEQGNLKNLDILGVYFKDEGLKSVYKIQLEDFNSNKNEVNFKFTNSKELSIKSSEFINAIDEKYSYYSKHAKASQLIISIDENIDELLNKV